jgi:ABC-type hemin transport system ATPase subunit
MGAVASDSMRKPAPASRSRHSRAANLARALAADGRTVVMVCHDLSLGPLLVDSAVLLGAGRVVASGAPETVLSPLLLAQADGDHDLLDRNAYCNSGPFASTFGLSPPRIWS